MRLYYIFNIKNDVRVLYNDKTASLYRILENIYYMHEEDINYGFSIFKELTNKNKQDELNNIIYNKLHKNLIYSRIDNEQTLLIAEKLAKGGKMYKKSIYWNILINLPQFILFFIPVWLLIKHNDGFNDIERCDVIVTCGRKMVRYAKHLKKNCCPDAKIVQIGNP